MLKTSLPFIAFTDLDLSVLEFSLKESFMFNLLALALGVAVTGVVMALTGYVGLLAWVARDASARGMDCAVLWMMLVMSTLFMGLLIYLLSRSRGNLMKCSSCDNERLQASALCPHCGLA